MRKDKGLVFISISIGLLFCLVVFPSNLKSIVIGISFFTILFYSLKRKSLFLKKNLFIKVFFFIFLFSTILYSNNLEYGLKKIETMSSLFVFPVVFALFNKDQVNYTYKFINTYLWIYIVTVFLFNTCFFLWFYYTNPNYIFIEIFHHYKRIIIVDIGKYSIHPIYMSMHCCLALIFSIKLFTRIKKHKQKILLVLINLVILFFMVVLAKKGPILALIITLLIWLFFEYKKQLKLNLILIISIISIFTIIPSTRSKFLELTKIKKIKKIEKNKKTNLTSSNIRFTLYYNSLKLIKKAPLLGYGIGDYNDELNKENYVFSFDENYNSHNQYISFTLIGGVLLLVLFLLYYYFNFISAIRSNNTILILILVFYGIMMLFENILERESGVIFFAFLINFFALKNKTNSLSNSKN